MWVVKAKPRKSPALLLWLLAGALAAAAYYLWPRPYSSAPHARNGGIPAKIMEPTLLQFTNEGLAGKMMEEVERVVRPRQAAAAFCERQGRRFACVLVAAARDEKYFELDHDLTVTDFPFLKEHNFLPPPFQVSRSMSTYRSVAKMALHYEEGRDQMIVLLCPKEEWRQLRIACPEQRAAPRPAAPERGAESPEKERF